MPSNHVERLDRLKKLRLAKVMKMLENLLTPRDPQRHLNVFFSTLNILGSSPRCLHSAHSLLRTVLTSFTGYGG